MEPVKAACLVRHSQAVTLLRSILTEHRQHTSPQQTGQAAQKASASPPSEAAPCVSLCESGSLCGNKHILVLLALCSHQKSQAESHSTS